MRVPGFEPVPAFNPYWDRNGATFEDPDGYRVLLQNAPWTNHGRQPHIQSREAAHVAGGLVHH